MATPFSRLIVAAALFSAAPLSAQDTPQQKAWTPASFIVTPKSAPRINGPKIFGVRPGAPFLYSIPATGARPMSFEADKLPDGLRLDAATGRISGSLKAAGEYKTMLRARNADGVAEKPFRIVAGEDIALTPPMSWSSYNYWSKGITQDAALRAARAMVAAGLDRHGWTYINIDDGWQGVRGGPLNAIQPDPTRFSDIKALCDEVHAMGLKIGMYSTPWTITHSGRTGGSSVNADGSPDPKADPKASKHGNALPYAVGPHSFAKADARQFAEWGIDSLKYHWTPMEAPETREMSRALRATGRDIVLNLSNYPVQNPLQKIGEVSKWAQSWRTSADSRDNWGRIKDIGFSQDQWAPFVRPGHFNDPDLLVVGYVSAWYNETRHTKLSPNQQYTQMSLWCLLSAPLSICCDLEKMDDFILGLLTNDEVLEIDQDTLCKQATQVAGQGDVKVYAKPLDDGSWAVGLFNLGKETTKVAVKWSDLKITGKQTVRDLWAQQDVGEFVDGFEGPVSADGVTLIRVSPYHEPEARPSFASR